MALTLWSCGVERQNQAGHAAAMLGREPELEPAPSEAASDRAGEADTSRLPIHAVADLANRPAPISPSRTGTPVAAGISSAESASKPGARRVGITVTVPSRRAASASLPGGGSSPSAAPFPAPALVESKGAKQDHAKQDHAKQTHAKQTLSQADTPDALLADELQPPPAKREAVVIGSSSVRGTFGRIISDDLESWGFDVTRRGVVSAGLARPDFFDFGEALEEIQIGENTAAVFLYVGMNDGQSIWLRPNERRGQVRPWLSWHDPRWPDVYTDRARELLQSICARGARQAIVLLPIETPKARLEGKMQRIRRLQRRAAQDASCATAVSTGGENGQFRLNGRRLRTHDGFHMTASGAQLVWRRIQQRALATWIQVARSGEALISNARSLR